MAWTEVQSARTPLHWYIRWQSFNIVIRGRATGDDLLGLSIHRSMLLTVGYRLVSTSLPDLARDSGAD